MATTKFKIRGTMRISIPAIRATIGCSSNILKLAVMGLTPCLSILHGCRRPRSEMQWDLDREAASFSGDRADRHGATEQIGAALHNEETEAVTVVPVCYLLILVEDPAEHLFGNADPRVLDLDGEIFTPSTAADKDSSRFRVLDRVSKL